MSEIRTKLLHMTIFSRNKKLLEAFTCWTSMSSTAFALTYIRYTPSRINKTFFRREPLIFVSSSDADRWIL